MILNFSISISTTFKFISLLVSLPLIYSASVFLFKPSNKSYVDRADVNKTLKLVLKYNFGINDITTHSLRHTYGTRCIEAGMQPVVLQRLMGHTDISTTLNTYTDVLNDFKNEEIEKVNQYYLQKDLLDNKILDGNEKEF